jgi:hypothetical protein
MGLLYLYVYRHGVFFEGWENHENPQSRRQLSVKEFQSIRSGIHREISIF